MKRLASVFTLVIIGLLITTDLGRSDDKPDTAIDELTAISDSVQAVAAQAILESNHELLASIIPKDLGIVWTRGQACSGEEALTKYDSLFFAQLGGFRVETKRERINRVISTDDYAQESGTFKLTRMESDSTIQTHVGFFTNYWQLVDGEWIWRRLFVSER
jgi:hypothetical protein